MGSTVNISIVQASLDGSQILVTDIGSYTDPVTSRFLTIFDANEVLLATINMGSALTYIYTIAADAALLFVLSITDATGVLPPYQAPYVAFGFYSAQFLNLMTTNGCGCNGDMNVFDQGEDYLAASLRYAIANQLPASQAMITNANTIINNPY